MALIKCPECHQQVSDKASSCPKCGYPINEVVNKSSRDGIKLVAAKCPSCGANINVDSNLNNTKCEYCKTNIIVDEAIQKYKIEISGEVEVKNLPKFDGLMQIANRHYDNGEYEDAYPQYCAAVELNPLDPYAVFRKGICKALTTNYRNFDISAALNSFKDAIDLEKNEDKKKQYVSEAVVAIGKLESFAYHFYNDIKHVDSDDIEKLLTRLVCCNEGYEKMLKYPMDDIYKELCYKGITNNCTEILKDHFYGTGYYTNGVENVKKFVIKASMESDLENKRVKYLELLNQLNPDSANKLKNKNIDRLVDKENGLRQFLISLSIVIFVVSIIKHHYDEPYRYITIVNGIFMFRPIFKAIWKSHANIGMVIHVLISIFCFVFAISTPRM